MIKIAGYKNTFQEKERLMRIRVRVRMRTVRGNGSNDKDGKEEANLSLPSKQ